MILTLDDTVLLHSKREISMVGAIDLLQYCNNGCFFKLFADCGWTYSDIIIDKSEKERKEYTETLSQRIEPYKQAVAKYLGRYGMPGGVTYVFTEEDRISYVAYGGRILIREGVVIVIYADKHSNKWKLADIEHITMINKRDENSISGSVTQTKCEVVDTIPKYNLTEGEYVDTNGGMYTLCAHSFTLVDPSGKDKKYYRFNQPIIIDKHQLHPKRIMISDKYVAEYVQDSLNKREEIIFYHLIKSENTILPIGIVNYDGVLKKYIPKHYFFQKSLEEKIDINQSHV